MIGDLLTEFYGDGEYENRRSEVIQHDKTSYIVNLYEDDELLHKLDFSDKNIYDIEDIAENWVLGFRSE